MGIERSEKVSDLIKAALEVAPTERAAFLGRACANDDELRREVESLLAYEDTADDFIETSALKLAARQLATVQREIAAGARIRHYRIVKPLGAGGMGKVYLAEDKRLQRPVAIKFLTEDFATDPNHARRFEREALTVSALRHPNIITIHEHFNHGGLRLLVTEFVEGETLRQVISHGAMDWREVVRIATQITAALNAAHAAGIIHRDIKPENVIRQSDGHVKVLDFGIAKHLERVEQISVCSSAGQAEADSTSSVVREEQTKTGQFFYTPGYASPEQARGEREVDGRTDVFSLGVMMFEMLIGQRPFTGATAEEKIAALLANQEAPDVREFCPDVPAALGAIVAKAVCKQRELRHQSAGELLAELQELRGVIESPNPEKATAQIAIRNANRLLTQFTVRYLDEPHTRIPLLKLWTIRRHANLRRGQKENELLRKSLRGGLLRLGAWALALAVVATIFAAWMSVAERWDERVLRDGHTAGGRRAAFSPNGRWLVSVGEDSRVRVWDFARRELKRELNDHTAWVVAVSFSPDGRFFATASWDRSVIVWNAESLEKVKVLHDPRGPFTGVAFSSDSKYLAAGISLANVTAVWRVGSWEKNREISMYSGDWSPFLFSPKRPRLLFNVSQTFDVETGQELKRPTAIGFGAGVEFSRDGSRLVTVGSSGQVVFYDADQEKAIGLPHFVHHDNGRAVAFSPDGKLVATGAENIILWNAETQEIITRWDYSAEVWGLTWSPDGRYLVSTHDNGSILLWDVITRERAGDLAQHSGPVLKVAFSPDGQHIASGGEDRSVLIWNAASGRKETALVGHQSHVNGIAFSRDGQWLVSNGWDGELIRWELAGRQPRWRIKTPVGSKRLSISPDGRWIAASDGVYDAATGSQFFRYSASVGHESWATMSASISADGKRLAAAGFGRLCVWETEQWRLLGQIEVGDSGSAVISPDGRHVITGNVSGEVMIFQTEPLASLGRLGNHATRVKQIAFSPDGTQVTSVGDDQKIKLWQFATRRLMAEIGIHTASIPTVAFSPDGKQLVSGGHDKSVRVYTRHRGLWGWRLD